jgi:hypothetical protein
MSCKYERYLRTGERGGEFRERHSQVLGPAVENASPDVLVAAGADAPAEASTARDSRIRPLVMLVWHRACISNLDSAGWRRLPGRSQAGSLLSYLVAASRSPPRFGHHVELGPGSACAHLLGNRLRFGPQAGPATKAAGPPGRTVEILNGAEISCGGYPSHRVYRNDHGSALI